MATSSGILRLLVHWWRMDGSLQMETIEEDISPYEQDEEEADKDFEFLNEEFQIQWSRDCCGLEEYIGEGEEGFLYFRTQMTSTSYPGIEPGEEEAETEFAEEYIQTLTEDEYEKMKQDWPEVIDNDA